MTIDSILFSYTGGPLAPRIASTFNAMEWAEVEIAAAKLRHPDKTDIIHDTFKHLCPSPILHPRNEFTYRAHAREIIERVINGEDLAPATDAELCCVFCEGSLKAPLQSDYVLAYEQLMKHVASDLELPDMGMSESYRGRVAEITAQARIQFKQDR